MSLVSSADWCEENDAPYELNPEEITSNFKILSSQRFRNLPMDPNLAAKITKLSTGEERHLTSLVPEPGGVCSSHQHAFEETPKACRHKASIITNATIISDVEIYYLATGEQ